MNRCLLPLIIGSLLLPLGCGGDDPAGPTFDPLTIGVVTLPPAVPTVAYSVTLSATGGDGSYTWSVSNSSTPGGLTLGANGKITPELPEDSGGAELRGSRHVVRCWQQSGNKR